MAIEKNKSCSDRFLSLDALSGFDMIWIMGRAGILAGLFIMVSFFLLSIYALTIFGFCRGMYNSNIFAALYDVIEMPYRSTATGVMLMFAFIVGPLAPFLLGLLSLSN